MRQETTDVRILVRAGELRCRNDWGSDLWREKGSVDKVLDVVVNETPGADRKPPRDNTDQLVAVARPTVTSAPLVGLAPAGPSESPDAEARRVSNDLNSELVRRARQQFRDRQQAKGYSVEPAPPQRSTAREAVVISNDYVPPSGRETVSESPIRFTERQASDDAFNLVPEVQALAEVPFRARSEVHAPLRTDDFENPPIRHLGEAAPETGPEPYRHEPEFEGDDEYPYLAAEEPWSAPVEREPERFAPGVDARERWPDHEPLIISDDQDRAGFTADEALESWSSVVQEEPEPLPSSLWSAIPICCQTCRDFRPAGDGGRGWCTNKWAFKHRRMVDADECPCETSIGHWWLPADVAWQGDVDVTALGQPTPLMDKYFGRPGSGSDEHFIERRRRRS